MAFSIRRLYYYLVCFTTLIMTIVGTVQVVQQGLDLAMPGLYGATDWEMRQRFAGPRVPDGPAQPTDQEIREMVQLEQSRERGRALRGLLGSLALILIAAPVYVYHWRRVRRMERRPAE
jgi:hypothetical protein